MMTTEQLMAIAETISNLKQERDRVDQMINDEVARLKAAKAAAVQAKREAREVKRKAAIQRLEDRLDRLYKKNLSKEVGTVGLAAKKKARKPSPVVVTKPNVQ